MLENHFILEKFKTILFFSAIDSNLESKNVYKKAFINKLPFI